MQREVSYLTYVDRTKTVPVSLFSRYACVWLARLSVLDYWTPPMLVGCGGAGRDGVQIMQGLTDWLNGLTGRLVRCPYM